MSDITRCHKKHRERPQNVGNEQKEHEEKNEGVCSPPCFEIKHLVYFHFYYLEYTFPYYAHTLARCYTYTLSVCLEGCIHYICILYIQVCKGVFALNVYPGVGRI